jgi:glycosyltransferase involved in cell wall biosynthesis
VRIVHVSMVYSGDGGVERYIREAAARLTKQGHDVTVITADRAEPERTVSGVRIQSFPTTRKVFGRYGYQPGLVKALASASRHADIVHAHQPFATPTLVTALFARCPSVLSPYYHRRLSSSARQELRVAGQIRFVASRFSHLAFVSDSERAVFEAAARRRFSNSSVIPPGVDDRIGVAEPMPIRGPVVLVVARLVPHKQVDRVLEACRLLSPEVALRIIGEGPQHSELQRLCRMMGYDAESVLLGRLEDELLWRWYRSADLFVSMSREEAFGITIVEALAAGASVLASDLPSHRDAVRVAGGEHQSMLVPMDSTSEELAEAMERLIERRAQGAARSLPPTWNDTARHLERLYQTLLGDTAIAGGRLRKAAL